MCCVDSLGIKKNRLRSCLDSCRTVRCVVLSLSQFLKHSFSILEYIFLSSAVISNCCLGWRVKSCLGCLLRGISSCRRYTRFCGAWAKWVRLYTVLYPVSALAILLWSRYSSIDDHAQTASGSSAKGGGSEEEEEEEGEITC